MIDVLHFHRRPNLRNFSIERLFDDIRKGMPADIRCTPLVSPYYSRGVVPRLRNVLDARSRGGALNHVTGDVHFLTLGLPRERTLLTIHDCGMLHRLSGWRRALMRFFWFVWPIRRCVKVTVVSEATRNELIELVGAPPSKIQVIHNCVSSEFVAAPAPFNAKRPVILLIGTAPNKNLTGMAAALSGLCCEVRIVGRISDEQRRVFNEHRLSLVELGDVGNSDIAEIYRQCDVLLFASLYEGFGMPILEAQAIGRPVVTSNCSSMAEVAGESACLVDPHDAQSIRAGLNRVITQKDYRERLIDLGFRNARQFSPERIAAEYAQLYRICAARAGSS